MIILEIAMIIVGLGAVIYSFYLVEEKHSSTNSDVQETIHIDQEEIDKTIEEKITGLKEKAEDVYEDIDDKLSKLSNEKIMGVNEYSDQVLDKIEKNHGEVVFLYDMMNEKQEELKKLIHEVDTIKADIHDEAAKEYQKLREQEERLDEIRKEIELDSLEGLDHKKQPEKYQDIRKDENLAEAEKMLQESLAKVAETVPNEAQQDEEDISEAIAVFDAEVARIEEEEAKEQSETAQEEADKGTSSGYVPLQQQEKGKNHNNEIVALYKKGRNVIEISRMLGLGQGEVKFVIDLYNSR